jgi:hypothetical protein
MILYAVFVFKRDDHISLGDYDAGCFENTSEFHPSNIMTVWYPGCIDQFLYIKPNRQSL